MAVDKETTLREAQDGQQRLAACAGHERQLERAAAARVGALLERSRRRLVLRDTPLLSAVSTVGAAAGIEIRPPPPWLAGRAGDPLEAIAKASRVRTRRVTLSGRWWRRDSGPLLGFLKETQQAVALLPEGDGYLLIDPVRETETPVDAASAGGLAPQAVMLYRPLPGAMRRPLELLGFALHGRIRELLALVAIVAVATLLGMLIPAVMATVMDQAIPDADRRLLLELGLVLLAGSFGMALFTLFQGIAGVRLTIGAEARAQYAVMDRLLRLRLPFFKRYPLGDVLTRTMAVSDASRELSAATIRTLLSSAMSLLNLGLLFHYSAGLAWIALLLGLVTAAVTAGVGALVRRYQQRLLELEGRLFGFVVQLLQAVGKLQVAGAQRRAFAVWLERYATQVELGLRAQRLQDLLSTVNLALPTLGSMLLFWFGLELLRPADGPQGAVLSLGVFLAFNTAFAIYMAGVAQLSTTLVDTLDTLVKARRIQPILDAEEEARPDQADPGPLRGEVRLERVSFRYGGEGAMVLDEVSLRAQPGEMVALVGPSGAGKSTLLRLLLGFEQPLSGLVAYDGQDLAGLDIDAVRRQLGVVLQSGRILAASLFDNIAASTVITLEQAWAAAEDAALAQDIRAMPMGMHTVISEGGGNLSGGQRQRLMIARALAAEPRILLLDEATSALDNHTQSQVAEGLSRRRITRLVIAHRLSTVREADHIFVLERGRIVEHGGYQELMARRGLFARLATRQQA